MKTKFVLPSKYDLPKPPEGATRTEGEWFRTEKGLPFRFVFLAWTEDSWYPNFWTDYCCVEVFGCVSGQLITDPDERTTVRIYVCGMDDCAYELTRDDWTMNEAIELANALRLPISKQQLSDEGFEPF